MSSQREVKCYTIGCENRVPRYEWPSQADRHFGIFCRDCLNRNKGWIKRDASTK